MKALFAGVLTLSVAASLFGQGPSRPAPPRFEAASIKQNNSDRNGIGNKYGPETFSWTNVPLRAFIQNVYGVKDYQVIGAPNWVNSDKWDITARTDGATTFPQKSEMAKTLMAERFQLKFHWETREMPVYSLVPLRDGPRFQPAKDDDVPGGIRVGTGALIAHKFDVSGLPFWLSAQLNLPVVDKAGLKGLYDFRLEWTPLPNEGNFATSNDTGAPPRTEPSGASIFTALQEQLGLKLEAAKGPVQVFVIDSVARPAEN
jgi:uncharacterized protein (TIGR03435 family)